MGTLRAQTRRPRRVACAVGGRMGERQPAKHHAPSRRKRRLSGRKESSSSVFFRAGWPWARADRPLVQFGKRGQRCSLLCFIASVGRFRAVFLSGPGSVSDSLRHSACKAHTTSKHSLASKTAAQRIKADLRIRATAVKERIEAVTNGQGRQGREDLQDQARPRRRNRLPSARAVRGVPRSDRETSTRADGVATTRA